MTITNKIVKGALVTILIIAIILVVYLVVFHNPGQDYTEFYILDQYNNTTSYPLNMTQNSVEKINIGIINQEHQEVNYTIKIKKDNLTLKEFKETLQDKEKKEIPYYLDSTNKLGINQTVNIELYKNNITNPYRTLFIRYNVI